jgi:ATP-dependent DNA helicase PIF1
MDEPVGIRVILDYVFKEKKNLFLHGFAGTGKSTRIKYIKKIAEKNDIKLILTSTTGVSAINIGGVTIHSWCGLGYGTLPVKVIINKMSCSYRNTLKERLKSTDIIIIDEISMLQGKYLDKINQVFQLLLKSSRPFAGKQIIFSGDILQLPPIEPDKEEKEGYDFFFKSKIWKIMEKDMKFIELSKAFRHPDKDWHNILMRIRYSVPLDEDHKILDGRVCNNDEIRKENPEIEPPRMFPLRWQVNAYNNTEMKKLKTEERRYIGVDTSFSKPENEPMLNYYNPSNYFLGRYSIKNQYDEKKQKYIIKILDNYAKKVLLLKIGANVMLTHNMFKPRFKNNLANGSQGIIKGFLDDGVLVDFIGKNELIKINLSPHYFLAGTKYYVRFQLPLVLSWATTIHRLQGCTLEKAVMDLGKNIFAPSQAYVALSRVKTLKGVYLLRYDKSCIMADEEALNYAVDIRYR